MRSFDIPDQYRSSRIGKIKAWRKSKDPRKRDFSPTVVDLGPVSFVLARHFGFCFGVENAIETAYKALSEHPGKRIFLISQMIHNPAVNEDLEANGVHFITDTEGRILHPWEDIQTDDIVLIPAFGTTLEIEEKLKRKGVDLQTYNTTCPFVEKVWKRSSQLGRKQFTVIIHGKPQHEETRATFSHAANDGPTIVIRNMEEARHLGRFMEGKEPWSGFSAVFGDRVSTGFVPEQDLRKVGVVNQTTMLASDTQAIADFFKALMQSQFGDEWPGHFADTRDTLCYATNDNQTATLELLKTPADLAIVVGGYNSSNTSHIVELCEQQYPTYFIRDENEIEGPQLIQHWNYPKKRLETTENWWPQGSKPVRVVITSGASCPDTLLERVMDRLLSFYPGEIADADERIDALVAGGV